MYIRGEDNKNGTCVRALDLGEVWGRDGRLRVRGTGSVFEVLFPYRVEPSEAYERLQQEFKEEALSRT